MTKIARGAALALAACCVFACGNKTQPPKPLAAPPSITRFEASSTRISAGESVTLEFAADHATEAELVDGTGTEVPFTGDASAGTVTLTPTATSLYVLKVKGEGGRDTAFVRVAVDEDLSEVFFVAVPPELEAGQSAQLLWSADHATSAKIIPSSGETIELDPSQSQGVVDVTPASSTTYQLVASGANTTAEPITKQVTITVHGRIDAFTSAPMGANVGEDVTLEWTTRGLDEVTISEAIFGELKHVTQPAEVAQGTLAFTIPTALPTGLPVIDGQPLHFTLTGRNTSTGETVTQTAKAWVGQAPAVTALVVPDAVTRGNPVPVSWQAANAVQATLLVNGLPVFETLPSDPGRANQGSFTLAPIGEDLEVTLKVRSDTGAEASATRHVAIVKPPVIDSFTVPQVVNAAGDAVNAAWKTHDATTVIVRALSGPNLFSTQKAAEVANGNTNLYPGNTTTLVLEAYNSAGEKAVSTQMVQVLTPAQVSASPSPALPGTTVTMSWNLDPATTADVVGIPSTTPVKDTSGQDYLELENHVDAREVLFDDPDNGIARLNLPVPFRFAFVAGTRESFWVSTNGFISFNDVGARPDNEDLSDPASPEVIAPFWDDLTVGTGRVLYVVDDSTTPRRLIIEWSQVSTAIDPASKLSFQVQLFENGAFRFVYQTLQGTNAAGEDATVGVRAAQNLFQAQLGYNFGAALLAENDDYKWFSSGPVSGSVDYVTQATSNFGFFSRMQNGKYTFHSLPVWVFGPGSLVVSEAMPEPGAGVTEGHWIELYNAQNVPVDVGGIELNTSTATQPFVLPPMMVDAKSFVVIGESIDPNANGGAAVDEAWNGLPLLNTDTAEVRLLGTTLSSLPWTSAVPGESVQAPEKAIDAAGQPITCTRTKMFGGAWVGTPGAANETCFEYALTPIPGDFEDLSTDGTEILASASDYYGIGTLPLPATFPYFGQPQTEVNVSMVGFLTFGPPLTDAFDNTNDTAPGSPEPNGVVAPFWDQLVRNTNGHLYMARRGTYTVISWQDFRIYATTSSLNFQVKLFDDGAIEFHYGSFSGPSGSSADRATGSSATSWIERLDGSGALPININTAGGIQPNSGWRFTPNP